MNKSAELKFFEDDFDEIVSSDWGIVLQSFKLGELCEKAYKTLSCDELRYLDGKVYKHLKSLIDKLYK